jgi:hypothetical protein
MRKIMNESQRTFRDRLLSIEKRNAVYKNKFEKEAQKMFEKKLSYIWRAGFVILSIIGLLAFIPFFELASSKMGVEALGLIVRTSAVLGAAFCLAWTFLMGWVAVRGRLNLRTQPVHMVVIGIALGFLGVTHFMFTFVFPISLNYPTDYRSICGLQLALIGFFFVTTVGLCIILSFLCRAGLRNREKLLEIEYRILELGEKMENRQSQENNPDQ